MTETIKDLIIANPIVSLTILLLTSLIVPPLFEKIKLPGLVGLLLAGILLGPNVLGLLNPKTETLKLLSDVGKIYLMFIAGLEIDLAAFRRTRNHSLTFGLSTFTVPLLTGIGIGFFFGFGPNGAILIGSLLASHTLLAYPIAQRLGIVRNKAVTVTIGATIFTDIGALLVLAVCISIHRGEFSWWGLLLQIAALGVYSVVILFGVDSLGREYFRRTGNEEGNQFLFILLALFLASVGAQMIEIENIVGAFLAGLAVNDVLGKSLVKEKVEFVGGVLFIPFFFIAMGLLINLPLFRQTLLQDFGLVVAIVIGLCGSKFIAALIVKIIYGYGWYETLTMWSLSLPQVAATLAAAFVGLEAGLLNEAVFNSVIVLMLITSTIGPILTQGFGSKLAVQRVDSPVKPELESIESLTSLEKGLKIIVPVYNPETESYLIEMAGLLVNYQGGRVFPLAIASCSSCRLIDPEFAHILSRTRKVLDQATETSKKLGINHKPILRIDNDIALGICYAARERDANLILMGYQKLNTIRSRLLGNVIEQVFRSSHCQVVMMRLSSQPVTLKRILVPISELSPQTLDLISFARLIAMSTQGKVTCLYHCPNSTSVSKQEQLKTELENYLLKDHLDGGINIRVIPNSDDLGVIVNMSRSFDLIVLNALDFQPTPGIIVSDWGTPLLSQIDCSLALYKK